MNVGDLGQVKGWLKDLLPLLKNLGIDPQKFLRQWEHGIIAPLLEKGVPAVVKRLTDDDITPAVKAASPAGERTFIRDALYLLLKEAFRGLKLPKPALPRLADWFRDPVDDAIVAVVGPQMDEKTPLEDAVRLVAAAYVSHVF